MFQYKIENIEHRAEVETPIKNLTNVKELSEPNLLNGRRYAKMKVNHLL